MTLSANAILAHEKFPSFFNDVVLFCHLSSPSSRLSHETLTLSPFNRSHSDTNSHPSRKLEWHDKAALRSTHLAFQHHVSHDTSRSISTSNIQPHHDSQTWRLPKMQELPGHYLQRPTQQPIRQRLPSLLQMRRRRLPRFYHLG